MSEPKIQHELELLKKKLEVIQGLEPKKVKHILDTASSTAENLIKKYQREKKI